MSIENLFDVSQEVRKDDLTVDEKKIYNNFYKVFGVNAPLDKFPLIIPHQIEDLKLGLGDFNVVVSLRIDNLKMLHHTFGNVSIKVDESNVTISTDEKGNTVNGNVILMYKKEGAFEIARAVRVVPRTEQQNFPSAS